MDTPTRGPSEKPTSRAFAAATVGAATVAGFLVCPLLGLLAFSVVDGLIPHDHTIDRTLFGASQGALAVAAALEPSAWLGAIAGAVVALSFRLPARGSVRMCACTAVLCLAVPCLYLVAGEPSHVILLAAGGPLLCATVLFWRAIRMVEPAPS